MKKLTKNFMRTFITMSLGLTFAFSPLTGILPTTSTHTAEAASITSTATKAKRIVAIAKSYRGVPYKFGASTKTTRVFDCSSFTKHVFARVGIYLPRTSHSQLRVGRYVKKRNLRPGDLVFFYSPVHHVGIYIGGGKFIHTYGRPGVTISNLNSKWWRSHYTTARRVL